MSKYRLTQEQVALIKELKKRRRKASDRTMDAGVARYFSHEDPEKMINKYLYFVEKAIKESATAIQNSRKKPTKNV